MQTFKIEGVPFDLVEQELSVEGEPLRLVMAAEDQTVDLAALPPDERGPDQFSLELWPAAHALARYILGAGRSKLVGPVLDLGTGFGLTSLAAGRAGLRVVATDVAGYCLRIVDENARRNGLADRLETALLPWGWPAGEKFPLIIGADLVYNQGYHDPLIYTIKGSLAPGGSVWLADPLRPPSYAFLERIPASWTVGRTGLGGGITLLELRPDAP